MQVDETEDGATLHGGVRLGSGTIESHGDHRIAMAFAIAGQISEGEVRINDIANVATSFPDFDGLARSAGFTWPERYDRRRAMPGGSHCPVGANLLARLSR